MKILLILLSLVIICNAWEPQVGDTCVTNYLNANQNTIIKISCIEFVGLDRCQTGYMVWAKTLTGKDSIMGIDASWIKPYRE